MEQFDRMQLRAMQREMDELAVELQMAEEIRERIRLAQVPPIPYEQTPEYIEHQQAIEAVLAEARSVRRSSRVVEQQQEEQAAAKLIAQRIASQPRIEDLKDARRQITELERELAFQRRYQSDSGVTTESRASAPSLTEADRSIAMLRGALNVGRRRQADLEALRREVEQQNAEVAARASKHARDLEAARAAAAAAAEYERQFQAMRAKLRDDVLREAFGDDVFAPLAPIRVPLADLFLEFDYRDDREFGLLSLENVTLDELIHEYRQMPHIWEFFANRCKPYFGKSEDDDDGDGNCKGLESRKRHSTGASRAEGSPSSLPAERESAEGHRTTLPYGGDEESLAAEPSPPRRSESPKGEEPGARGSAPGGEVPESVSLCAQALDEVRGPLRDLEEEQRLHEELVQFRADRAARIRSDHDAKHREASAAAASASQERQGDDSDEAFHGTVVYALHPLSEEAIAPVEFATPNEHIIARALGEQGAAELHRAGGNALPPSSASKPTPRRQGDLSHSLSRRNLTKILRFNPSLDAARADTRAPDGLQVTEGSRDSTRGGDESAAEYHEGNVFLTRAANESTPTNTRRKSVAIGLVTVVHSVVEE